MFDPRPLCCSSLTTAVGGTTDTNFVDSAHPTVARIKSPTAVVKLLQHSGLGSNTGMGFLRTNDLSEIKTGELNLDFGVWFKTGKWFGN